MPEIKVQHVVSCSSEDLTHKADNLLKSETYRKWKCSTPGERQASVILQFEKASLIHSIDVGNEGSAFVEILVGNSSSDSSDNYQVILVTSSFMSPVESKNGTNTNRVRMFGQDKLSKAVANKRWDRVKVVCSQLFNKHNTYGLSFVKFHSPPEPGQETSPPKAEASSSKLGNFKLKKEDSQGSITPGSYFKNREKEKEASPLTGAAACRAASTLATPSKTTSQAKPDRTSPGPAKMQKQPIQKRRLSDESSEKSEREKTGGGGRREEKKEPPSKQPPLKKRKSEAEESKPSEFKKLMADVTFVLSGFQNPFRAELRDKAVAMGAKYKSDWGSGCTHLICAFANTPKYNQVKGKGKIVMKQWILDSHKKKILMPWKRYDLKSGGDSSSEEESETDEEEEDWKQTKQKVAEKNPPSKKVNQSEAKASPVPKKGKTVSPLKGKSPMKRSAPKDGAYSESTTEEESDDDKTPTATRKRGAVMEESSGGDTEDELRRIQGKPAKDDDYAGSTDEETSDKEESAKSQNRAIPDLPDFFSNKKFFIYGKYDTEEKRQVKRLIIAFGGILENYMKDDVEYVITNSGWDDNFDKALTENASLAFVRPKWLYTCNEKSKFVPHQPYVVVPN